MRVPPDPDTPLYESAVSNEALGGCDATGEVFRETLDAERGPPSVGHADTLANTDELRSRPADADDDEPSPQRIGKYRVLHRLGEGGMGTVFAARDEELDRKLAIKLVKPRLRGSDENAKRRLLREAKALAHIDHPNVIRVYEVGTWRNGVFVAMELVDGWTLARFQYRNVTTWQALLEIYKAAGRGLAAAHAGGLVHRDFKPDNVLVTRQGEARVIDFGLARAIGAAPLEPGDHERPDLDLNELQLTRTGVVLGTPAYMAPEQHKGGATDARTDQFSFCVALYEALYAQRPFAGSTFAELTATVLAGEISDPPPFIRVPGWIRRVLKRGLSVDPSHRFPSMEGLLDALDHDPARRWRGLGITLALGLALAVGGASWRSIDIRRARRAEATRVRVHFNAQRQRTQEQASERSRSRALPQAKNAFVLGAARARVHDQPSVALAVLKHLDRHDPGALPRARALATEALARGLSELELQLPAAITQLAFSRDGEHLALADASGHVRLIHCESGTTEALLEAPGPLGGLVFSSEDAQLVLADAEGMLHFFAGAELGLASSSDPSEGSSPHARGLVNPSAVRRSHRSTITALAASPVGGLVAAGGDEGLVTLWKASSAGLDRRLLGHEAPVTALTFANAGALYTADASGKLFVRELDRRSKRTLDDDRVLDALHFHTGRVIGTKAGEQWSWGPLSSKRRALNSAPLAHFEIAGDARVGVDELGTLRVELGGELEHLIPDLPAWEGPFAVAPSLERFASGDAQGRVVVRRLGEVSGQRRFGNEARPLVALALAHTEPLLALANWIGELELHDLDSGERRPLAGQLPGGPEHLEFSPSDTLLLATHDRSRRLWALDSGASIDLPEARCETTTSSWTPDSSRFALAQCDLEGKVEVFTAKGELVRRWHFPGVRVIALRPDGQTLIGVGTELDSMRLLELESAEIRALPAALSEQPAATLAGFDFVAGTDPGVRVATLEGQMLRLWHWDPVDGQIYPLGDQALARPPWPSQAHTTLLLPLADAQLRVWELASNRSLVLTEVAPDPLSFALSEDGQHLLLVHAGPVAPIHQHIDLSTGARRRFVSSGAYEQISGDGSVLARRAGARVETWHDPSPSNMLAFLVWLDEHSARTISPTQLLESPPLR